MTTSFELYEELLEYFSYTMPKPFSNRILAKMLNCNMARSMYILNKLKTEGFVDETHRPDDAECMSHTTFYKVNEQGRTAFSRMGLGR